MSKTNFYDYGVSFRDWAGVRICFNCTMVLPKASFTGMNTICNKCLPLQQQKHQQFIQDAEKQKLVKCPICKAPDTKAEREDQGWIVHCTNLVCRSNMVEKGKYSYDKKLEEQELQLQRYVGLEKRVEEATTGWQDRTSKLVADVIKLQQEVEYWKEQALKRYERNLFFRDNFPWERGGKGPDVPVSQERYNKLKQFAKELLNSLAERDI